MGSKTKKKGNVLIIMNLNLANLSELQYLARYTDYREEAICELNRRINDEMSNMWW